MSAEEQKTSLLYIHDFISVTEVEGPGKRACVWLQGCSIRCNNCMVPHTWNKLEGKQIQVEDLLQQIVSNQEIEGLTVLGGEPLDQPEALSLLLTKVKEAGLSIILFTGYVREQIVDETRKYIISLCDILIDGPYIEEQTDFSRPWVGSKNQCIHFLTDRYIHLKEKLLMENNKIEVRVSVNGEIKINGMLPDVLFQTLQDEFGNINTEHS